MSDAFDENWNTILLRDYLECLQIIRSQKLVLFESSKTSAKHEEQEKRAISSRIKPRHVENRGLVHQIQPTPKLLGDLFESTAASLFLDGGETQ